MLLLTRARGRFAPLTAVATVLLVGAIARAVEGEESGEVADRRKRGAQQTAGSLTFLFENDVFLRSSDDNYTAGGGLSWVSDDTATYGAKHFARRMSGAFARLPFMQDARYRQFVALTLGIEMYTPTDIEAPIPPPEQQPYAGVLFLDGSVYAHGPRSMHAYTGRVGCVGPCSGAGQIQVWLHETIGSPVPQGWDYQLGNELLLNVSYQYHRRVIGITRQRRAQFDLAAQAGGALGNYYTGAGAGLVARFGWRLPDNYAANSLRTGGASDFVGATVPGRGWQAYVFAGVQGYGVARFLPTDGNTFRDSPSVDRDDFLSNLATGLVVGKGRLSFSWTRNTLAGFSESGSRSQDFGTLTLTYFPSRRGSKVSILREPTGRSQRTTNRAGTPEAAGVAPGPG